MIDGHMLSLLGGNVFVENIKAELGIKAGHRSVEDTGDTYALREPIAAYQTHLVDENGDLSNNAIIISE